jgi:hypothetical protein
MRKTNDMHVVSYTEQEDVDRAFADYDIAELTLNPRPTCASRDALFCRNCHGTRYTYNNTGGCEPGQRVCNNCGAVAHGPIFFEQMFGRPLTTRTSNYKRIHHWHERLSQLMLMESQIPTEHMLAIGEKLLDGTQTTVSKDTIRAILRPLGLQVYIEKWLQIIERCTGVLPPCPGPIVLERLDTLFLELQRPFVDKKIDGRRNFLNYNYVFCRLFQIMGCTKFCMFFPLIRSKAKLKTLDDMWHAMASSVGWLVPPLEHVAPFSVRFERPDALLSRLKARCAGIVPAVPRTIPMRMGVQKWDHRRLTGPLPVRAERRLIPPEQRPQTLSLRLKRKRQTVA